MISFITPVFYKNTNSHFFTRSLELIEKFYNHPQIELIIADSSKNPKLKTDAKNIKIIYTYENDKVFSPAKAKNKGAKLATKKYLLFFDVDLAYSSEFETLLFSEIKEKLESKKENFIALPFLYLTQSGTKLFEKTKDLKTLKESFLKGENHLVESFAANGSLIVLEKEYFLRLGGYSDFYGHGGEDFELLHRIFAYNPHSIKNADYYTDFKAPFLAQARGFRYFMAYYSLPNFFKNLILLHRWHPRPLSDNFYSKRPKNENLLLNKMQEFDKLNKDSIWQSKTPLVDIKEFIKNLQINSGYPLEKNPGFFSYKKGVKPLKKPLSNKIRKLILRPKEFFKDIKLFKR
ncbi:MAG: glycosyltransferase [Helicobacter sp.]|nr:glycosyltransferase [Helicobacteraceae bacterium]MDY3112793.1 glycosyltransferase [Helicobacter sp.]